MRRTLLPIVLASVLFASSVSAAAAVRAGVIRARGVTVRLQAPRSWGSLVSVRTDEWGAITRGPYAGNYLDLPGFSGLPMRGKTFKTYPYVRASRGYIATVAAGRYAPRFADDSDIENGPLALTAIQKQRALDPLLQIYAKRSIAGLPLIQMRWAVTGENEWTRAYDYEGAWWRNVMVSSDRIAPAYLENADATLRGAGFFVNEAQEYFFAPFIPEGTDVSATQRRIASGYAYLAHSDGYRGTELERVMTEIRSVIASLDIR